MAFINPRHHRHNVTDPRKRKEDIFRERYMREEVRGGPSRKGDL